VPPGTNFAGVMLWRASRWPWLTEKLRGHDAYYGVTGNFRMLSRLRCEVARLWRKWLLLRNRGESLNWERFQGKLRVFPLYPARIIHSSMQ
jgi:hypothetical protein